jgi:hypothetical protein
MPTTYGAKDVGFFLVHGRSVIGTQTQVEVTRDAKAEKTTPIGETWATFAFTGEKSATVTQDGFFDATADQANDAICARQGTSQVVCLGLRGNTRGVAMIGLEGGFAATYKRALSAGNLHKASATYTVTGVLEDPIILKTLAAVTADGNTEATSVDNTTDTSAGGAGYLQVTALTLGGYTNLVVTVRHSTDNITFATLLTFTAVTAAFSAERVPVAGAVSHHLATSYAFTGSGSGPSATILVGFARA